MNAHDVYSNIGADEMLFSEKDLEKSMDKIETINFHQVCHMPHSSFPHSPFIHSRRWM